jgi:uncharacterized transporter YbjL
MNADIRKISVGKDYPEKSIHYQVGKYISLKGNPYEVHKIEKALEEEYENKTAYHIFLKNEEGIVYWKTVSDVPVVVENNIDFD